MILDSSDEHSASMSATSCASPYAAPSHASPCSALCAQPSPLYLLHHSTSMISVMFLLCVGVLSSWGDLVSSKFRSVVDDLWWWREIHWHRCVSAHRPRLLIDLLAHFVLSFIGVWAHLAWTMVFPFWINIPARPAGLVSMYTCILILHWQYQTEAWTWLGLMSWNGPHPILLGVAKCVSGPSYSGMWQVIASWVASSPNRACWWGMAQFYNEMY